MKRRRNNLGQTTLMLAILGAIFGWSLLSKPTNSLYAAGSHTAIDQGLRDPHDIVCLRSELSLEDEGRTIRAQVSRGQKGEVIIDLANYLLGDSLILASSERTHVRAADSSEPIAMRLAQDDRTIVIVPEAEWGRVHRDTGLELEYGFME